MTRRILIGLAVPFLLVVGAIAQKQAPIFQVQPGFFILPNNWITGQGSAVAVDKHDNVWIIHRPRYIPADKRANAAPAVMEFDSTGKFIRGWGGPSPTNEYDWPDQEH